MHCRLDEWNAVYEMVILGRDLNGFVGRERDGYEGVHGGFGFGIRNVCVRGVGGGGAKRGEKKTGVGGRGGGGGGIERGKRNLEFGDATDMIVCGLWNTFCHVFIGWINYHAQFTILSDT